MAETRFASRFRRVVARLRARGFDVVEEHGCYSRTVGAGTSSSKDLLDVRSHLVHHTAGGNDASDRRVVRDGRTGLRGPLAQWLTERDGTLRLLASGYANHAGPTSRRDEGNSYSTGNEIVSAGLRASDFNPAQVTAAEALAEEMAREFGYGLDGWTVGHKEAGVPRGRKVDPAFSMPAFRGRLSRAPAIPAVPLPTPTPEDWFDMATPAELGAIVTERVNDALEAHLRAVRADQVAAARADKDQTAKLDETIRSLRVIDDRVNVAARAALTPAQAREAVAGLGIPQETVDVLVGRLTTPKETA